MNLIPATNSIIVIIDENWEETLTRPTFYKYTYLHNGMRQLWPDLICPLSFETPLNNYDGWKDSQHLLKRLAPTQRDCGLRQSGSHASACCPTLYSSIYETSSVLSLHCRTHKEIHKTRQPWTRTACPILLLSSSSGTSSQVSSFRVDNEDINTKKIKGKTKQNSALILRSQVHSGSGMPRASHTRTFLPEGWGCLRHSDRQWALFITSAIKIDNQTFISR